MPSTSLYRYLYLVLILCLVYYGYGTLVGIRNVYTYSLCTSRAEKKQVHSCYFF